MRTTVRLDDALLERAKREAVRRKRTLTSMIDEGLRLVLSQPKPAKRRKVMLPVSPQGGGLLPGVDINNTAALLDILDAEDGKWR